MNVEIHAPSFHLPVTGGIGEDGSNRDGNTLPHQFHNRAFEAGDYVGVPRPYDDNGIAGSKGSSLRVLLWGEL
ncbi:MAG: hypothetical protein H0U23_16220 [Blastocatellia bacterium]|nr:hypothetical protein [Blastocatellia bacterium]MDQ3117955.1 hypothetical protein [Verrucomicrobiota bacterium]